jgi:hypothetical protein
MPCLVEHERLKKYRRDSSFQTLINNRSLAFQEHRLGFLISGSVCAVRLSENLDVQEGIG